MQNVSHRSMWTKRLVMCMWKNKKTTPKVT